MWTEGTRRESVGLVQARFETTAKPHVSIGRLLQLFDVAHCTIRGATIVRKPQLVGENQISTTSSSDWSKRYGSKPFDDLNFVICNLRQPR